MRQKFVIQKNDEHQKLIVQEYAELDKDILSFICEERHDLSKIEAAVEKGRDTVIAQLRTDNMYPPIRYAQAIADVIIEKMSGEEAAEQEVVFDDNHYIAKGLQQSGSDDEIDEEDGDLDELLDEDLDGEYDDKKLMKDFKSSIKIADDESLDVDEDK